MIIMMCVTSAGAGGVVALSDEYKLTILKVGGECVYNTNPPPPQKLEPIWCS